MPSQVFYRKWRPQTLAEVVGQEPISQTLRNALVGKRISHAYLFCGPRGTGKTSTARILAKGVNCLNPGTGEPCNTCSMCQAIAEGRALDVIEIDAASNTSVEHIRDLREKVNYAPNQARYKVYIIDEVHMLSTSAANALLKTLEEPPAHVIFILATTEVHKLLPTILSRCQRFDFRRLSQPNLVSKLEHICRSEGIRIERDALNLIARSATGSARDAENLLEQLTTYYGSEVSLHQVQAVLGITGDWRAKELVKHIVNNDVPSGMATVNAVSNDGIDLKQFNRELVEYLRALLLIKTGSAEAVDLVAEDIAEMKDLAGRASLEQILRAVKLFGQLEFGFDNYPTLPLELALVDCALPSEAKKEVHATLAEAEPAPPQKAVTQRPVVSSAPPPRAQPRPAPPVETVPAKAIIPAGKILPLEASGEVEKLRLNWRQVIEQAPPETRTEPALAFLRSAGVRPTSIENGTVVLAFKYPYHKEQMEKLENQRVAEKVISNFLGRPCRVTCVSEDNHLLKEALKMGAKRIEPEGK